MADDNDNAADVVVGAVAVADAPPNMKALRRVARRADALVAEAAEIKAGERQCKHVRKDKTRCKRYAIKGGFVCMKHGGGAPQVRRKANMRLLAAVEPTIVRLIELSRQNDHRPTALGAVKEILQRAGGQAIGAVKDASTGDIRPVINVGIAVGGINQPKPEIAISLIPAAHAIEGEVAMDDEDDDGGE